MASLMPVFNAGKMAVVLNVGTLVQPTTKAQYTAKTVPLPPKLFSHNDQQSYFQASSPEGATSGWGGRIGDLFQCGQRHRDADLHQRQRQRGVSGRQAGDPICDRHRRPDRADQQRYDAVRLADRA